MKTLQILASLLLIFTISTCTTRKTEDRSIETAPIFDPPLDTPMPVNPKVKKGEFDNGIKYIIQTNKKPENRAELRLVVNVGSVLEDDDQQGLAHFAEHMAFNGTENFKKQEIVDYLESIGMRFGPDINAYTSFDETVYMLKVPTDSTEMVEQGFQILEDWAKGISFEDDEIDKERGVVIEEWRLGQGAQMRMFNEQLPVLFKDSRYAERLPIGKKEILENFPYDAVKRFYRDWYRPELMSVIAVGDFDPVWIESLITEHFESIPPSKNVKTREEYNVPNHTETLIKIASDPEATGSGISIYYKLDLKEQNSHGAYREGIITNLYNAMLNIRLNELTTKPNAPFLFGYSAQGRFVRTKEVYLLGAGVADNGIERGLKALLIEAERVARHGFISAELERAKINSLKSMERAFNERDKTNSRVYASEYIRHFLIDEPIPGIEYEFELYKQYLPGITVEEVNRLARSWLPDENRVILGNLPEKDGINKLNDENLLSLFDAVKSMEIEPYEESLPDVPLIAVIPKPSAVRSESRFEAIETDELILGNGTRILMKKTDFKNDQILFRAYSNGGTSLLADEDVVAGRSSTSIVGESGYGPFNRIELGKTLAGKLVRVSPYIGSVKEGISGSSTPEDLETMFQLIHLIFTAPRKDSTAFLAYKERMEGFLANRSLSPESAYRDTIGAIMSQYSSRYRPWSTDLLEELDLDKSYKIFRDRFSDIDDFTFIFVGNFEPENLKNLCRTYLGSLPPLNRNESWIDDGIDPPKGIIKKIVLKGQEPKSLTQLTFAGDFDWNRINRYELQSMLSVLKIKLREVMREDLGGTYGVRVSATTQEYPDEEYRMDISFGSSPDRVKELTGVVFEQIDSLVTFGTTVKYLNKVKETQRRSYEVNLKENSFWLNAIEKYLWHEEEMSDIIKYDELVESLTLEAIQNAAKKYFDMNNFVQVSLYPEDFEL